MNQYDPRFAAAIAELRSQMNQMAGGMRRLVDEKTDRSIQALQDATRALAMSRSGGVRQAAAGFGATDGNTIYGTRGPRDVVIEDGVIRLEDIPGRRVPFFYLVEIPIGAGDTSPVQQSFTISPTGPFVATRRMAAFLSLYSFTYTDPETGLQTSFNGRSHGRWRPISSDSDLLDGQPQAPGDPAHWNTAILDGGSVQGFLMLPNNMSGSRSMGFDGYLKIENAGSSFPRQDKPVPSAFWCHGPSGNAGVELPALDFFERGEVVTLTVQPTHPLNAAYGNVAGNMVAYGTGASSTSYPFLDGQFDQHEGLATPNAFTGVPNTIPTILPADPMTRVPEGILVVALEGYRIQQPPGAPY